MKRIIANKYLLSDEGFNKQMDAGGGSIVLQINQFALHVQEVINHDDSEYGYPNDNMKEFTWYVTEAHNHKIIHDEGYFNLKSFDQYMSECNRGISKLIEVYQSS